MVLIVRRDVAQRVGGLLHGARPQAQLRQLRRELVRKLVGKNEKIYIKGSLRYMLRFFTLFIRFSKLWPILGS